MTRTRHPAVTPELEELFPGTPEALPAGLMSLLFEGKTGVLTLRYADGRRRLGYWSDGGVVAWRTEPPQADEALGELLVRAEKITREELDRSLRVMEEHGCAQEEALLETGVLTFDLLLRYRQRQAEHILRRVLGESGFEWRFSEHHELPERFSHAPVRVGAITWRHTLTRYRDLTPEARAARLAPWSEHLVLPRVGLGQLGRDLGFRSDERGFVELLESVRYRVRELLRLSDLPHDATTTLLALTDLGLVELRADETAEGAHARLRAVVEHRLALARAGTLLERLHLPVLCTAADVEVGWIRASDALAHLERDCRGTELAPAVAEIRAAIQEAYERLSQPDALRAYRLSLLTRRK